MKQSYKSDIILGDKYEDIQTGITGTAVAIYFFQFACERVTIEYPLKGEVKEITVDAPRLRHVETQQIASTKKTGGPARKDEGSRPGSLSIRPGPRT